MPDFDAFMTQWANGQRGPCVVCLGDSVTAGYTSSGVIDHELNYPARLRKTLNTLWPMAVPNIINSGVAGDSAKGALQRLDRDALVYRPDVLVIAFGLNDSSGNEDGLGAFESSLKQIIEQARGQGVRWLVLVTPPMMATKENANISPADQQSTPGIVRRQTKGILAQYAQSVREIGKQMDVPVADVYAQWEAMADSGVDTNYMLANGLNHPTPAAHDIHAKAIFKVLRTPINEPGKST